MSKMKHLLILCNNGMSSFYIFYNKISNVRVSKRQWSFLHFWHVVLDYLRVVSYYLGVEGIQVGWRVNCLSLHEYWRLICCPSVVHMTVCAGLWWPLICSLILVWFSGTHKGTTCACYTVSYIKKGVKR